MTDKLTMLLATDDADRRTAADLFLRPWGRSLFMGVCFHDVSRNSLRQLRVVEHHTHIDRWGVVGKSHSTLRALFSDLPEASLEVNDPGDWTTPRPLTWMAAKIEASKGLQKIIDDHRGGAQNEWGDYRLSGVPYYLAVAGPKMVLKIQGKEFRSKGPAVWSSGSMFMHMTNATPKLSIRNELQDIYWMLRSVWQLDEVRGASERAGGSAAPTGRLLTMGRHQLIDVIRPTPPQVGDFMTPGDFTTPLVEHVLYGEDAKGNELAIPMAQGSMSTSRVVVKGDPMW